MTAATPPPERISGSRRPGPSQSRNADCSGPEKSNSAKATKAST